MIKMYLFLLYNPRFNGNKEFYLFRICLSEEKTNFQNKLAHLITILSLKLLLLEEPK